MSFADSLERRGKEFGCNRIKAVCGGPRQVDAIGTQMSAPCALTSVGSATEIVALILDAAQWLGCKSPAASQACFHIRDARPEGVDVDWTADAGEASQTPGLDVVRTVNLGLSVVVEHE
jgi:hypothetical protein